MPLRPHRPGNQSYFAASFDENGRPVPVLFGALRSLNRKRDLARVVGFAVALPSDVSASVSPDNNAIPPALVAEAFSALAEAVLITDARGKIIFANSAATSRFCFQPS